jgi:hypothetical protein
MHLHSADVFVPRRPTSIVDLTKQDVHSSEPAFPLYVPVAQGVHAMPPVPPFVPMLPGGSEPRIEAVGAVPPTLPTALIPVVEPFDET